MTATAVEEKIEIDPETGLPVVPEGMFWRVGEEKTYISSNYSRREAVVRLMQVQEPITKKREMPIYGRTWWGGQKVVGKAFETYTEQPDPEPVYQLPFSHHTARKESDIPSFADHYVSRRNNEGDTLEWTFTVPITAEGIAWLATGIFRSYEKQQEADRKYEAIQKAKREAKDKFYGDYPPKTLVNV